jgi:hypothetical protein
MTRRSAVEAVEAGDDVAGTGRIASSVNSVAIASASLAALGGG